MTTFRRAVKDAQKQERRHSILQAALHLFEQHLYQDILLDAVAKSAGIAKGTLYLYFQTREELFLAAMEQLFLEWFDEVDAHLYVFSSPGGMPKEQVADVFATSLAQRETLLRLLVVLHSILEHNLDFPTALRFKQTVLARMLQTGGLLEQRLLFLTSGQGMQVLLYGYTLVVGLVQQAYPSPVMQQVFGEPGLEAFRLSFHQTFSHMFRLLLSGWQHEGQDSS